MAKATETIGFHVDKEAADRQLELIGKRAEDLVPVLIRFGSFFRKTMQEQFNTEGMFLNHSPWAPLSPAYASKKMVTYGPGAKILEATKSMVRSFTTLDAKDNIQEIGEEEARFGSKDPKAKFHEFGTARMPKRPIVGDGEFFALHLGSLVKAYIGTGKEADIETETIENIGEDVGGEL